MRGWYALLAAVVLHGAVFVVVSRAHAPRPAAVVASPPTTFALVPPAAQPGAPQPVRMPRAQAKPHAAAPAPAIMRVAVDSPMAVAVVIPPPVASGSAVGGGGGGTTSGGGGGSGAPTSSAAATGSLDRARFDAAYQEALRRITQHRRYPELARRREVEGSVTVAFRVAPSGTPLDVRVARSADADLDEAAVDAVRDAQPLPVELAAAGPLSVRLDFRLDQP